MQGECNGKMWKRSFTKLDTAEPPLVLCKDNANEWKESLLLISRAAACLMQRQCKRVERELALDFPSAACLMQRYKKNVKLVCYINYFDRLVKPLVICDVILSKSYDYDRNKNL